MGEFQFSRLPANRKMWILKMKTSQALRMLSRSLCSSQWLTLNVKTKVSQFVRNNQLRHQIAPNVFVFVLSFYCPCSCLLIIVFAHGSSAVLWRCWSQKSVSLSVREWQGHQLSCPGQIKKGSYWIRVFISLPTADFIRQKSDFFWGRILKAAFHKLPDHHDHHDNHDHHDSKLLV